MKQNHRVPSTKEEIISYQKLRTFIGIIGVSLPFAVVLGCYFFGGAEYSWQPSISHYYYSKMHIVFVCTLCVLGGFLITYKGKPDNPWESRVSNFAGYCVFSVAAFPTTFHGFRPPANGTNQYLHLTKDVTVGMGSIHFLSAGLLFGCFILFCWVFFQKPDEQYTGEELEKFKRRKRFYKICGWGILLSILGLFGFYLYCKSHPDPWPFSTFWFETTSLLFFGSAWLVKGSVFWKHYPILSWIVKPIR